MKKISVVLLALLLAFSLPLAAYAADEDYNIIPDDDDGGLLDGLLGGLVDGILDGLKGLFIPDDDFFVAFNSDIQNAIDKKTGGLASSFKAVTDEFNRLQDSRATNNKLNLTLPDNHLYKGYKGITVNLLGGLDSFSNWFRALFSAFMVVGTVVICYRKVIKLFKG